MAAVSLGDERLPHDPEPRVAQPPTVRAGIEVAPEHRRVGTEPPGLASLVRTSPQDSEKPAPGSEPTVDLLDEGPVLCSREMDDGVERDHGPKAPRGNVHLGDIAPNKPGVRHEASSPPDLPVGDVHACHSETCGQDARSGNPRSRPEVQDRGAPRQLSHDRVEPCSVVSLEMAERIRRAISRPVSIRDAIPARADDLLPARAGRRMCTTGPCRHAPYIRDP